LDIVPTVNKDDAIPNRGEDAPVIRQLVVEEKARRQQRAIDYAAIESRQIGASFNTVVLPSYRMPPVAIIQEAVVADRSRILSSKPPEPARLLREEFRILFGSIESVGVKPEFDTSSPLYAI
jgi:hypothetical protein